MKAKPSNLILFFSCLAISTLNLASESDDKSNDAPIDISSEDYEKSEMNEATHLGLKLFNTSGGIDYSTNLNNIRKAQEGLRLHNDYLVTRTNQLRLDGSTGINKEVTMVLEGAVAGFGQTIGQALGRKTIETISYYCKSQEEKKKANALNDARKINRDSKILSSYQERLMSYAVLLKQLSVLPHTPEQKQVIANQIQAKVQQVIKDQYELFGIELPLVEDTGQVNLNAIDNLVVDLPHEGPAEELEDDDALNHGEALPAA